MRALQEPLRLGWDQSSLPYAVRDTKQSFWRGGQRFCCCDICVVSWMQIAERGGDTYNRRNQVWKWTQHVAVFFFYKIGIVGMPNTCGLLSSLADARLEVACDRWTWTQSTKLTLIPSEYTPPLILHWRYSVTSIHHIRICLSLQWDGCMLCIFLI